MNKFTKLSLILLLLVAMTGYGFAAGDTFGGETDPINYMLITSTSDITVSDFTYGMTDEALAGISFSNNSSTGYTITLESTEGGIYRRAGTDGSKDADIISYNITMVAPNNGDGAELTATAEVTDQSLAAANLEADFDEVTSSNSSQYQATVTRNVNLTIDTLAKPQLFHGTYTETLTITIADN